MYRNLYRHSWFRHTSIQYTSEQYFRRGGLTLKEVDFPNIPAKYAAETILGSSAQKASRISRTIAVLAHSRSHTTYRKELAILAETP